MKKGWQTKTLGDVLEVQNGYAFESKGFNSTKGMPLIRIRSLEPGTETETRFAGDYDKKYVVKAGDLLIGMDGEFGCYEWKGEPALLNQRVCRLQGFSGELVPRFLFYGVNDYLKAIENVTGYATVKHLSSKQILGIEFPVPSLPEQQRIVGILDEAFDGLATATANAEKNLHNARALFESHLQSVFTQRGNGWVGKSLHEVCAITSTLVDPRKEEFLDLTHVGAGNIESKTGLFVDLKTAREEGLVSGKFLFDESTVLYSKIRPYLMKVARPDFKGLCSADMYPLTPFPNEITRNYLFHLLLSKGFTDYAIQGSARAGMPKVNREHLFEFKAWMPDVKRQKELAAHLDDLHEETQRLEAIYQQKLAALEALKKSLLHQAFSGQL
ncbi:MAG: restriction endonuclease subunit S [Nitrospira sp.]|nr:restriction endonuclease subunit S [Nitrospira sp.]